ncbi:hypothetical protein SDC9_200215 [bioreactor metagenome]|uniref:Uncharacterized protein n=1 Tax=bioreactor metagenome TaxID=1076179 RepID=A0A645IZC2_9ZZZZ
MLFADEVLAAQVSPQCFFFHRCGIKRLLQLFRCQIAALQQNIAQFAAVALQHLLFKKSVVGFGPGKRLFCFFISFIFSGGFGLGLAKPFLPVGAHGGYHVDDVAPHEPKRQYGGQQAGKKHTAHTVDIVNGNTAKNLPFNHHHGDGKAEVPRERPYGVNDR